MWMSIIGKTMAKYRVIEPLGRGGMGEVFLADDLTLNRRVGLKFLPDEFAGDSERMARFEREAKLLASLNHPNIAAIYGLEQAERKRFIVMELVEGQSLAQRLIKGPLPIEEALAICRQIAEGLEEAHEKGVIHRDLKPANVMITEGGKVKILDFGLAKAISGEMQSTTTSQSPTITSAMTQPGVILGTAAYMSPEQAKGKTVDKRADIWAFGCILYECLTGKRAFEGDTVTETLAAILKSAPDWQKLPANAQPNIRIVLRRCLEKNVSQRFGDVASVRILMEEKIDFGEIKMVGIQKHRWFAWSAALVCLMAALVLGYRYFHQAPAEEQPMLLEVNAPPTSEPSSLAISPNGRSLVYVASTEGQQRLWLRPLDKKSAQPLAGTEGATFPFWSPDSRSIGFFAGGKLKRIDIGGEMPVPLADAPVGMGGTWNRDDVIVFTPNMGNPLYRVAATGGDAVAVTKLNVPSQISHNFPRFQPDGQHILYFALGTDTGIYITSLNRPETKKLLQADSPAIYAQPGYLLFSRQSSLFAQPFNPDREELTGKQIQIADSVEQHAAYNLGAFSVSETGVLAYWTVGGASLHKLVWFERSGKEIGAVGEPQEDFIDPELSPDGRQVAVDQKITGVEGGNLVWLIEVARGVIRKFTNETKNQLFPVWSPDGSRIVFSTYRGRTWDIYQMPANGSGKAEILLESFDSRVPRFANDWSHDERFILYTQVDTKTSRDLWVLPMSGSERKPFTLVNTSFEEQNGQFSPDVRWIAYQSNESGRFEVYIQPFPGPGAKVRVSTNGGMQPRWHPDGNELFYIAADGMLMAAPIHIAGQTVSVGAPVSLFPSRIPRGGYMDIMRIQYAISRDGRRFLVNTEAETRAPSPITIVTNWTGVMHK
jgi:eukaryotic-like serine/threonine-protein kinase